MKGTVLEINQSKKFAGRTYVKWVVLELHNSTDEHNKNGITWKEEHINANLDSMVNMPIAAEFLDDWEKDEPFGHGLSDVKDGIPLFEYSVVVGTTEKGYVDTVEVNGEQRKVLIAEGYLFNQRYPKFVQWLKSEMYDSKKPDTSVEISAKEGHEYITYEDGWKETGRVPKIFDFSGSAILGIEPADDSAVLLELNHKKGDKKQMSKENEQTVVDLNNKIDQKNTEINDLKDEVKNKGTKVDEVQAELNTKQEELNTLVESKKEVDAELNQLKEKNEAMEKELTTLREFKEEKENDRLKGELNEKLSNYTDDEKEVVKEKVNEFNQAPSTDKMTEIVNEINSSIAQAMVEQRKKSNPSNEQNNYQADDIFGDVVETNNDDEGIF